MNENDGNAAHADGMKSSTEVKEHVIRALFHMERMACRLNEIQIPADLRHPLQEVCSRLFAALYEVQAISYDKPSNFDEVTQEAALFDDVPVKGFVMLKKP
jgi:hypothetical protein